MKKILIVDDEKEFCSLLKEALEATGKYKVVIATDGRSGMQAAQDHIPDLILLDIMLPEINGYEICRRIRAEGLDTPIIMLTAKGQESDILLGLNLGADDYVTKPFSIRELLARANAFLRRRRTATPDVYRFGDCALDMSADRFTRGGAEVPLTPKESGLLKFMVSHAGRALTRDEILRRVWGYDVFVTSRSIDRCVNTLRKKIEPDSACPTFIKTIREIGYRFEIPEDPSGGA